MTIFRASCTSQVDRSTLDLGGKKDEIFSIISLEYLIIVGHNNHSLIIMIYH